MSNQHRKIRENAFLPKLILVGLIICQVSSLRNGYVSKRLNDKGSSLSEVGTNNIYTEMLNKVSSSSTATQVTTPATTTVVA